ncbi:3-deoxy-7-phosphoheptulonate synthase [Apiospora arundinis]
MANQTSPGLPSGDHLPLDLKSQGRLYMPLPTPFDLRQEIARTPYAAETVNKGREDASAILNGLDAGKRLLVIVGPCSIHETTSAKDYCGRLLKQCRKHSDELLIIMRCYVEKPRTTVGWKGLLNDPDINGSFDIGKGLTMARQLFLELAEEGIPLATEFVSDTAPLYLDDLLSFGAIGARTVESQLHRELASGLPFPVGLKNGTTGGLKTAIDAITATMQSHHYLSTKPSGPPAVICTSGNPDSVLVLRGGAEGTNFDKESILAAKTALATAGLPERVVVDCSHGNSPGGHTDQLGVVEDLAYQLSSGEEGIVGVLLESNIEEGKQEILWNDPGSLQYGVSITDTCIGWVDTERALQQLAEGVKSRRECLATRR